MINIGNIRSSGFSPLTDVTSDSTTTSVKESQMSLKVPTAGNTSQKIVDKQNTVSGMKRATANAGVVNDVNLNKLNNGLENGQFTYSETADADPNYTGGFAVKGVPSMFNNYTLFTHALCNKLNDFMDIRGEAGVFNHQPDQGEITLVQLLEAFSPSKVITTPYYANDFLYAKYYNKIPLNHLVTLRRFPYPTYDSLEFDDESNGEYRPLAQAITYFGEPTGNTLSQMIKINGKINWKNVSAQIWDVESTPHKSLEDSTSIFKINRINNSNSIVNIINSGTTTINNNASRYGTVVDVLTNNGDLAGRQAAGISAYKATYDFSYTHKVYGPINVIKDTMTRDTGIGADFTLDLVFEYQLKSYNGINPKLAFLDLLNNILALTYYHARWWGGANRFFPKPMAQFGFLGDQNAFYSGDYGTYFQSVGSALKSAGESLLDIMGDAFNAIMSGNFSALANMVWNGASKLLDIRSKKSRPNAIAVHSLVSGVPVGEYHCIIGNPLNPIAAIGNLVMQSFDIQFSDTLGFDDFPDGIKLTCHLKKARSMDSGDIASLFNMGAGRMYVPENGITDILDKVSNSTTFLGSDKKTREKSVKGVSQSFGAVN